MHDSKTLVWILAICSSDNARAIGRTAVQLDAFNCMDSAAIPRMALNITNHKYRLFIHYALAKYQ